MKTPGQEPLVSVVTPFYNTGEYLAECIESVLAQSYRNWEYILVNNRSTDKSLEIANNYAAKDVRARVYTNETFLTQVQNYNHALSLIAPESKYCKIVQADDWIFPQCLTEMVEVAEAHPSTGIIGACRLDDRTVNCDGLPYRSTFVPGRDICRLSLLRKCFVFGSPTSIMFRSDIVRGREPFYGESSYHEDTEACY
ncbi:MAG: glycosyltransferase family A protein, partial [Syntrophorhabdales bacterium]